MSSHRLFSCTIPTVGERLALVCKRHYRVRPGARAVALAEPPVIVELPTSGAEAVLFGRLDHDSDMFAAAKPKTDVLVVGHAHAPGGATSLDVGVEVGPARKLVRAFGDRKLMVDGGRLRFTRPEPFQSLALTWENAYGGRDEGAEANLPQRTDGEIDPIELLARMPEIATYSYPRNALGKGFFVDIHRERLNGSSLPNLEDPEDPVTPDRILARDPLDWIDRPVSACFGPIDVMSFPRSAFFFAPAYRTSSAIREVSMGVVDRHDLDRTPLSLIDLRVYNCAPAGLGSHVLHGHEHVRLWNLHPKHACLEFDLPSDRPRLILEPPNAGARELEPKLSTVEIAPDRELLTLTWAGTLPVAAPYSQELLDSMRHVVLWPREAIR